MAKPLKGHDYRGTAEVPGRHVHIGQKRLVVLISRTWIRIFDLFVDLVAASEPELAQAGLALSRLPHLRPRLQRVKKHVMSQTP